jgi:ribosomal protein L16 Arg81 hydroxylase
MPAVAETAASSLDQLVAPLTRDEFLSVFRERKLTLLRDAKGARYSTWISWDAIRRLIERGEYPRGRGDFRVSKESVMIPQARWSKDGKVDVGVLEECLAKGFSVIMSHIEPFVPPLGTLCADVKSRLSEVSYAGVIVTSGDDGAFKLHYDPEDLIIVQVEGTKRWQIFGPAVANPVVGMPKPAAPKAAPVFDEVLEPGDLLFVPAGNWHHCQAGPGRSVHLGLFFVPPTGYHAVKALASELLAEEVFRTPLTRLGAPAELAAIEARIKDRLVERVRQMKLAEFPAEWSRKP